jgi:hypothetical protein
LFLFALPAGVLRYYYHQHERWPDAPALVYFWTSVTPVASLFLFVLLLSCLPAAGAVLPETKQVYSGDGLEHQPAL